VSRVVADVKDAGDLVKNFGQTGNRKDEDDETVSCD
jgi:hypothetical protein